MSKFTKYINSHISALQSLDIKKLEKIKKILETKIKLGKNIFTCGNGGSASVSNHFLCDFNKGSKILTNNKFRPKVISLSNNIEIITAISNDIKYEEIFAYQLENYSNKNDLLISFSCSGNSKNIVNAIKFAKKRGVFTISFTGFASKKIRNLTNLNLDLGVTNYGICEDIFQSIMHLLSQNIGKK